jgi:hypothetical protein
MRRGGLEASVGKALRELEFAMLTAGRCVLIACNIPRSALVFGKE